MDTVERGDSDVTPRRSSLEERASDGNPQGLANALGWFSIGLGVAQIVAPRGVARMIGAEPDGETTRLMRAIGLREISSGVGILSNRRPESWVRARVAGDMMDLALLGKTLLSNDSDRGKTVAATVAVLGVTALDILTSEKLSQANTSKADERPATRHVRRAITIAKSPEEVAAFWNESGGDQAVLDESVTFVPAPGGRGTEVHLDRTYKSPGPIASLLAKFRFEDPDQIAFNELRALKQVLETGEITISDAWQSKGLHPAQPDA
jgi:hypothetical protein